MHRILQHIAIEVGVSALEQDGILGRPSARFCVVVPGPKPSQAGVWIVQAAGKPKGLEAWPPQLHLAQVAQGAALILVFGGEMTYSAFYL